MLDPTLSDWLDRQADALDRGDADPAALLPRLAAAGVLGVAVEERLGGAGGTLADAVERVAAVAARSLTRRSSSGASAPSSSTCCRVPTRNCANACSATCWPAAWPAPPGCPTR